MEGWMERRMNVSAGVFNLSHAGFKRARFGRAHVDNRRECADNEGIMNTEILPFPQTADCAPVLNWDECPAVSRNPDVLAGTPVFKHSRMPVYALFENLEKDTSIAEFLDQFDGITEEQVKAVLKFVAQNLKETRAYSIFLSRVPVR